MTSSEQSLDHSHHAEMEKAVDERYAFGFWIYLLTDVLLFGSFFATYHVLRPATFGHPGPAELFSLNFVAIETALLLSSSFTFGLVMYSLQNKSKSQALLWMLITFILGAGFIGMEIYEFSHLIHIGQGPQTNAFLSGFFGLVGLHGLHVSVGLIWLGFMTYSLKVHGVVPLVTRKIRNLSLFWHFLDVIWIFVFTFVYLMGAI
jgi:cytochrome o ubiquinol oxidase subunit 3